VLDSHYLSGLFYGLRERVKNNIGMVRRNCVSCGAPLKYTEDVCGHCGATYEQKKKKRMKTEGFRFVRVTQYILFVTGLFFLWQFGESGRTAFLQLAAIAALTRLIEREILRRVDESNERRMRAYLEEVKRQKKIA
jgi:predicted nucleic acid-binding Zn ribbon protein